MYVFTRVYTYICVCVFLRAQPRYQLEMQMVRGSFHLRVRMIDSSRGVTQTANFTDPHANHDSIHFPLGFIGGASSGMGEIHVRAAGKASNCTKLKNNATKMPSVTTSTLTITGSKPSGTEPPTTIQDKSSTTGVATPRSTSTLKPSSPKKSHTTTRAQHPSAGTIEYTSTSQTPSTKGKAPANAATSSPNTTENNEAETDSAGKVLMSF